MGKIFVRPFSLHYAHGPVNFEAGVTLLKVAFVAEFPFFHRKQTRRNNGHHSARVVLSKVMLFADYRYQIAVCAFYHVTCWA